MGCSEKTPVFNGEIFPVEDCRTVESLKGTKIDLDDMHTGYMSAFDSLMVFVSDKFPDYYMYVYSLNSKKRIVSLIGKGNGPDEFRTFSHAEQYRVENNRINLWGYDCDGRFYSLNLTGSIQNDKTLLDTVIRHNWMEKHISSFGYMYMLDNGKFLMKNNAEEYYGYEERNVTTLTYYLYHQTTDNKLEDYQLYNRFPFKDQNPFWANMLFLSFDRLKPDKSKIAMGMERLSQINILDLETGNLKGFRLKNTPDFGDIPLTNESIRNRIKFYYTDLCVSDNHIYTLYADAFLEDIETYPFQSKWVHIYDWDGNFIKKLELEHVASQIAFDYVNNLLYTYNENDEIYCYKIE
jgi:hypothetical protein